MPLFSVHKYTNDAGFERFATQSKLGQSYMFNHFGFISEVTAKMQMELQNTKVLEEFTDDELREELDRRTLQRKLDRVAYWLGTLNSGARYTSRSREETISLVRKAVRQNFDVSDDVILEFTSGMRTHIEIATLYSGVVALVCGYDSHGNEVV